MTKILAVLGDDVDVAAAQRSLDLSVTRYKGGVTSDLESDHGASDALSDEVTAVNILGRHRADTVLLVQALGGGWGPVDSAAEPECCGELANNTTAMDQGADSAV